MCVLSGCPESPKSNQGPWEPPATPETSFEHAGLLASDHGQVTRSQRPISRAEARPSLPVGLVHQGPEAYLFLEGSVIL